jgi:predicted AAA+ superfamily ATPase
MSPIIAPSILYQPPVCFSAFLVILFSTRTLFYHPAELILIGKNEKIQSLILVSRSDKFWYYDPKISRGVNGMKYIERQLEKLLARTMETRPLIYVNGPRQAGKSALAGRFKTAREKTLISFDSPLAAAAVRSDPAGFIKSLPPDKLNVIDEVQLVPEVFSQFKIAVDEARGGDGGAGSFLLTASADIFALPELARALAGRMSTLTLLPFSSAERAGTGVNFIEKLWSGELAYKKYKRANLAEAISAATFPEISLDKHIDRRQWFDDYLSTILRRDIKTIAEIRDPRNVVQMLTSFSQRVGSLLNNASVTKETGIDAKTYAKYKALAHSAFLTFEIEPWPKPDKPGKRFVKQSKLYFNDTNLLCHVMRRSLADVYKNDRAVMGRLFENFIATEIVKNARAAGGRFKKGIVIHTGNELSPFGENLWAIPADFLWE